MWNRIDPYDLLVQLNQRVNQLEQQVQEYQENHMWMTNLIHRQNKLIKKNQEETARLEAMIRTMIINSAGRDMR